jgi:CheY-like chemotaxis protein/HPt (histidine-containing phosphotransfer) domain-containing protein
MTRKTSQPIHRPLRVLLAEDNRINQQFAALVLNKAGHSVEIAGDGRQAVDALLCSDFDVVLMDIQMPELDGVQATRQIRALPQPKGDIPIIAVTAHAMIGAREEYLAAGMDDYISKPFQPALLLSTLAKICDRNSAPFAATASRKPGEEANAVRIDELPVLDLEQLGTLGSVFSLSKLRTLAALYMLDVEARLVLMDEHRAMNDFDGVSRQAHMIVSTAGNLGAKQSSALAHLLEVSCTNRDDALSDRLIGEVRASCVQSSGALKRWLGAQSPAANRTGRISNAGRSQ